MIPALVKTSYAGYEHSESIFLTPSCVDSILLLLLEDNVKAAGNAPFGESADVEAVLGVYIEEDELS